MCTSTILNVTVIIDQSTVSKRLPLLQLQGPLHAYLVLQMQMRTLYLGASLAIPRRREVIKVMAPNRWQQAVGLLQQSQCQRYVMGGGGGARGKGEGIHCHVLFISMGGGGTRLRVCAGGCLVMITCSIMQGLKVFQNLNSFFIFPSFFQVFFNFKTFNQIFIFLLPYLC